MALTFEGCPEICERGLRRDVKGKIFTGMMMLLGVFALTGFPPFSIFFSEIMIIIAAFTKGSYLLAAALLLFLAVIFGAFINHFGKMLFGNLPKGMVQRGEPLSGKLAFLFLTILICTVGIALVFMNKDIIWKIQRLRSRNIC